MPNVVWYYCHACGYRSQFIAATEDKPYRCPKCHERRARGPWQGACVVQAVRNVRPAEEPAGAGERGPADDAEGGGMCGRTGRH